MIKTIKIYSLQDPITNEIRYIGKTTQRLEYRLSAHLAEAKYRASKSYKNSWIIGLLNKNVTPVIELLDEIPYCDNWEWLEQYWISQFRVWGFKLVNLTDGGDGNKNQYRSKESIEKFKKTIRERISLGLIDYQERSKKISKSHTGKIVKDSTKQKLRLVNLGMKKDKNIYRHRYKKVLRYSLKGEYIDSYDSLCEASQTLNISKGAISNCCKSIQKTAGGYKWSYE